MANWTVMELSLNISAEGDLYKKLGLQKLLVVEDWCAKRRTTIRKLRNWEVTVPTSSVHCNRWLQEYATLAVTWELETTPRIVSSRAVTCLLKLHQQNG